MVRPVSVPDGASGRRSPRRSAALLLGLVAVTFLACAVFDRGYRLLTTRRSSDANAGRNGPPSTPFFAPGIRTPPAVPAVRAGLADDEEIIGVSAGGKHRAYRVRAMEGPTRHVVNDLLGEVPVTVTYCDRNGYARVLTGPERGSALNVSLGGWLNNQLLLRADSTTYFSQNAGRDGAGTDAPPYPDHAFTRTTWKEWRDAHPDTDAYVEAPPARPPESNG